MEMRRIYDENFNFRGYMKARNKSLARDEYYVVAGVIVISQRKILITQRAANKTFPHQWEFTMGSVIFEETPLEGALRELSEEVGIVAKKEALTLLGTLKETGKFSKIFLLKKDVDKIVMQKEEVEDYRFVDIKTLKEMLDKGEFAAPMAKRLNHYMPKIEEAIKTGA